AGVVAGLGFGYAVLARVFPVLFLIPLVVSWAQGRLTGARDAALARCLATAAVLVTAVTLVLVAMPATRTLSEDFVAKIERHNRGVYSNHVVLGSLLVFHATPPPTLFVSSRWPCSPSWAPAAMPWSWPRRTCCRSSTTRRSSWASSSSCGSASSMCGSPPDRPPSRPLSGIDPVGPAMLHLTSTPFAAWLPRAACP